MLSDTPKVANYKQKSELNSWIDLGLAYLQVCRMLRALALASVVSLEILILS